MKGLLEITCQASDVKVVRVDDVHVIRADDKLTGIVINIPVAAAVLAALLAEAAVAL